jgi:hypothetical protein
MDDATITRALIEYLDQGVALSTHCEGDLNFKRPPMAYIGGDDHWLNGELGSFIKHNTHNKRLLEGRVADPGHAERAGQA